MAPMRMGRGEKGDGERGDNRKRKQYTVFLRVGNAEKIGPHQPFLQIPNAWGVK